MRDIYSSAGKEVFGVFISSMLQTVLGILSSIDNKKIKVVQSQRASSSKISGRILALETDIDPILSHKTVVEESRIHSEPSKDLNELLLVLILI